MNLSNLPTANRVLGLDFSTRSLAYCVFNGAPVEWGKVNFAGADIYERMLDASKKSQALADMLDFDYVASEGPVRVNSQDTLIKMSLVLGAILPEFLRVTPNLKLVKPMTWQSYIGNKPFKRADLLALKKEITGKSDSWYRAEGRRRRKQFTMDYFNERWPYMDLDDDDISDSAGVSLTAFYELTGR